MKIKIEIPIEIDEPLTSKERQKFQNYIQGAVRATIENLFSPGVRMHETNCRFSFSEPKVTVR